ncbi:PAS domain S-box protein [Limibacter armeniacum]|uniref:PAS domain S-box protein n=1 Tax=Limibacter armeniacum TaxID=466084 RepID=UPI002FE5B8BD
MSFRKPLKIRNESFWLMLLLTALSFGLIIFYVYYRAGEQAKKMAFAVMTSTAEKHAQGIEGKVELVLDQVDYQGELVEMNCEDGDLDLDILNRSLLHLLSHNGSIHATWATFEPEYLKEAGLLANQNKDSAEVSPFWYRTRENGKDDFLSDELPYRNVINKLNLKSDKTEILHTRHIFHDYDHKVSTGEFFTIVTPITLKGKRIGLVGADIKMSKIKQMINGTSMFWQESTILISNDFQIVAHPHEEWEGKYVEMPENLRRRLAAMKPISRVHFNRDGQEEYYETFIPMNIRGVAEPWFLSIRMPMYLLMETSKQTRNYLLVIVFAALVVISLGMSYVVSNWRREINNRKQIAEEYKHTSELLRDILDNSERLLMFTVDKDFKLISFNAEFGRILEMISGAKAHKGNDIFSFFPANYKALERKYKADDRHFTLEKFEYHLIRALDGDAFSITELYGELSFEQFYNPFRNQEGEIIGATCFFIDVTELKIAEEQLMESESKFRQLYETSGDGFVLMSVDRYITDCNDTFVRMMGYDNRKQLLGKHVNEFTPEKWHSLVEYSLNEIQEKGYSAPYEKEYLRRDGTPLPVEVRINSITDEYGNLKGLWGSIRDISERKYIEEELQVYRDHLELMVKQRTKKIENQKLELEKQSESLKKAHDEIQSKNSELAKQHDIVQQSLSDLEQAYKNLKVMQAQLVNAEKMASLGQLTAGIAHEINNPINFVFNNVTPLKEDVAEIKEVISRYREEYAGEELQKLWEEYDVSFLFEEIELLLQGVEEGASRTASIVQELKTFSRTNDQVFDKANVELGIDATLTLLNNKIRNKVEIIKEYGNIPEISCNLGKLNQVFMNILSNAVQAIPDEGVITIKTAIAEGKKVPSISITIRDNGMGMEEQTQNKIFDPFFTTKKVGEGTGLGLSISFGIIQDHGGTIKVNSKVGEGTVFEIVLPIEQPEKKSKTKDKQQVDF